MTDSSRCAPLPAAEGSIRGRVTTITRLRINCDGSGVRSVVFLYGCPLSCQWCCNPETRFGEDFREVTAEELLRLLARDLVYFRESGGGVTFSGGEPLCQYAFIREFARLAGGQFSINLETSLHAPRQAVEALLPYIDHWLIDFKGPDEDRHREFTGVSQRPILENLAFLAPRIPPERITLSCPLIPGLTATQACAHAMLETLRQNGLTQAELHPHRKHSEAKYTPLGRESSHFPPLSREEYEAFRTILTEGGIALHAADIPAQRRKCDYLKAIRKAVADRHNIPVDIADCPYRGPCPGTCPKCEDELARIRSWLYLHDLLPFP